jgi:hypothetical protein
VVLAADSASCRLTAASRSVSQMLPRLPAPRGRLVDYGAALAGMARAHAIDLIIPTCEEVFYLSRVLSTLPSRCEVFAPPFGQLELLHSKLEAPRLAAALAVRVPETIPARSIDEARDWSRGSAVVLKPEFSRFGVHVRSYPRGIPDDAPALAPLGQWVAQRLCTGREVCSYAIAVRGRLCVNVCYEPAYRLARSSSYYFEPFPVPEIDRHVARLVEHLGYHGQISFDWFLEPDGVATMIECNPRATSGLHLLPDNAAVADAICNGLRLEFDAASAQPRMLASVMLSAGLAGALAKRKLHIWWRDWKRAEDVLVRDGDRAPLLGAMRDAASFALMARRQGCSLREASTRDIEWDGESLPG